MTVESWHPVTCPAGRSIESGARPTRGPSTSVGTTISRRPELVEGPLVARNVLAEARASTNERSLHFGRDDDLPSSRACRGTARCPERSRRGASFDQREVPPLRSGRRSPVVPSLSKDRSLPRTRPPDENLTGVPWTLDPSNSHHPTPTTPFTIPPIVRPTPTEANS